MSKQKILVSGCGLSYSGQERKVWTNILKIAGADVIDVSGPAVSNQWILDRAFIAFLNDNTITAAVIQLTALGKLDVEVSPARESTLVESDTIRNFIHQGIWPSSASQEHLSKKLWYEYLYSPNLEQQELFCKILLLDNWCKSHNIKLTVIQGYSISWSETQLEYIKDIIYNLDQSIWEKFEKSIYYKVEQGNTVPNLGFQFNLVLELAQIIAPDCIDKIYHIQKQFKAI
jgi:hypothetical protein